MAAHVTAMWPYAEAWHMAPSSQPVPRKGAVRARSCGPARAGLFLADTDGRVWLFQTETGRKHRSGRGSMSRRMLCYADT